MNGKQAKRLRRAAVGLVVTLSEAGKTIKRDGYQEIRTITDPGYDPSISSASPALSAVPPTYSVQLKTRDDTLRGIYKTLKSGKLR